MADNTINVRIKDRSDTEANWTSKNPVLLKGERAITDGTGKYKIGDGKNTWGALPYYEAMTSADRTKLNGVAPGANKTTVDSSLSSSSTNPVQNKVVNSALAGKSNTNHTHDLSTMINTLSTSGSTPTDEDYFVSQYAGGGTTTTTYHRRPVKALLEYIKGKLAKVAISGSYNDLSNKPTIPSVGNGTITIKQAGAVKGSFTTNQSGATTIELTDNNTNTWRGIQDNLTSTSTTDSLSANQGKILNESKLMHKTINTSKTDLNTLTETGIYHIVIMDALNAPTSHHGTLYVDTTVGTKYQVFMSDAVTNYMHKRYYDNANKEWLGWIQLKFTDTVYTHPSYTAKSNGLYKVTVDDKGHVSGTTAVAKSDITALGIPSTNTTYSTGTASTSGLTKLYTGTGTATDGTMTQSAIKSVLDGKSNNGHTHDDRYYTESEVDSKLSGKANTSHNHTISQITDIANASVKSATKATSANLATTVVDYGDTSKNIKIGYSGNGITGDNIKFIAGYTGGDGGSNVAKIKDVDKDALKSWLGLGSLAYSSATIPSVGNGTVTVKQNGTSKGTFTMNQSGNTTIELTDNNTVYTHPTTSGNKHIPSGGSSGQILRWSSDGTAVWGNDNNTTYTLSSITGTLAVSKGGTGSTTAAGGRSNLGAVGFVCQSAEPSGQNNGDLWFKEG